MAQSIDAQKLKNQFIEAIERGTLCGTSVLANLADIASSCAQQTTDSKQVVAYTIHTVFQAIAYDYDERAVSADEATALANRLHQPVIEAIEYLKDTDPKDSRAIVLCEKLIRVHLSHLPFG